MQLMLAPMEGVVDHLMRDMLTHVGGFDLCVTEFVRVVDQLLPPRVFRRLCPELDNGGLTPAGIPVRVQLLGQEPNWLAENAVRAVELGSHGVDLNFGCPAKTVNKSRGGAVLLKEPESLYRIVKAVRDAVPEEQPVTAKMRLGFSDKSLAIENAQCLAEAGAAHIVIHARTKEEGYRPPAYWDWIAKVKQHVQVPIIANGEIWDRQDALKCQAQSTCENLMLGRGALAVPNLAHVVRGTQEKMPWEQVIDLLVRYSGYERFGLKAKYYPNRIKQWLRYIAMQYSQADTLYREVRVLQQSDEIVQMLYQYRDRNA